MMEITGSVPCAAEHLALIEKVEQIASTSQHPYAKLNELVQSRVICAVRYDKASKGTSNSATVTVKLQNSEKEISSTHTELSLKSAKEKAALEVFELVMEVLKTNMPTSFADPDTPTATSLSKGEVRLNEEDAIHAGRVSDLCDVVLRLHLGHPDTLVGAISVDLEMWEQDHSQCLEVGIAAVSAFGLLEPTFIKTRHIINHSNIHLRNTKKNLDQRGNFAYGKSEMVQGADLRRRVEHTVAELTQAFDMTYIVGHSIKGDIQWLRDMGCTFMEDMEVIDLAKVYRWAVVPLPYHLFSMEKMLKGLNIPASQLHNAGNDAKHGLDVLSSLVGAAAFNWTDTFADATLKTTAKDSKL